MEHETKEENVALEEGARHLEESADTVEQALEQALSALGISEQDAEICVLSHGVAAVPGESMSGGKARVAVYEFDAQTRHARQLLTDFLGKLGVEATVTAHRVPQSDVDDVEPPVNFDVSGDDLGILIGWRGETLQALQSLYHLMLANTPDIRRKVFIDVERYRVRREDYVRSLARRLAERVRESGEKYVLDPMQPYERRVVHVTLQQEEGVRTESTGAEPRRRVEIIPTGPATGVRGGGRYNSRNDWGGRSRRHE